MYITEQRARYEYARAQISSDFTATRSKSGSVSSVAGLLQQLLPLFNDDSYYGWVEKLFLSWVMISDQDLIPQLLL
jgi:hypothetical protein